MLKMYTRSKKWIVVDGEIEKEFDNARDAWEFVFIMRKLRPSTNVAPKSLYPVNSLIPNMKNKKVVFTIN